MNIDKPSKAFFQLPGMKRRTTEDEAIANNELRVPVFGFLPNKFRNHFIAFVGEFCGTFLFLFFAFAGTQVANAAAAAVTSGNPDTANGSLSKAPNAPVLLYISLAFGFSLAVNVWVFFRISGGLFNPAVALALALIGAITWTRAGIVFIAELLASMTASGVVLTLFPGPLNVATTLSPTTSTARGLFIEMFLTAELVFAICMLAAEKHKGTFLAPIGIGLALFVAELAGVFFTGGSLNPARSFGPAVALHHFPHYHWIYWLGPALGALLAVGFYRFVKMLEYETANPGQDFNEKEAENFTFDEETARGSDIERPTELPPRSVEQMADLVSRGSEVGAPGSRGIASISSPGVGRSSTSRGMDRAPGSRGSPGRVDGTDNAGNTISDGVFRDGPRAEEGDLGGSYRASSSGAYQGQPDIPP